jgi:hypothetical protein
MHEDHRRIGRLSPCLDVEFDAVGRNARLGVLGGCRQRQQDEGNGNKVRFHECIFVGAPACDQAGRAALDFLSSPTICAIPPMKQ